MKNIRLFILALLFASIQTFAQTYTYDSNNRLTKVVYDNGTTITYTFDALGNRTSKKVTGSTAITYTISATVTPTGSGYVTGTGKYNSGVTVELNAIANAGYKFSKWSDGYTNNPRTITVTGNQSYTAQFEQSENTSIAGDITNDGKVNTQDLNALINAYLANTNVTQITDLDNDSQLSIADITYLISMIYSGSNNNKESNGHQYVDLGLPSGTLWATCNVGANKPEEPGDLYAWGEIETKDVYSWETYKWCDGTECKVTNKTLTKYCDRGGYGILDGKISLDPEDDVAHVKWGGKWHIPTSAELHELVDNCTKKWIKLTEELHAYEFTGPNGNSIILPAAGEFSQEKLRTDDFNYWSSELHMHDLPANNHATHAIAIEYGIDFVGLYRYKGYAVRPVLSDYTPIVHQIEAPTSYKGHEMVDLGLPSGTLWAKCNLGASSPEGYGCYYAWGEATGSCEGKSSYKNAEYKWYNGSTYTKYTYDGVYQLEDGDDAAKVSWGGEWRMPTYSEISELVDTRYTQSEWTAVNGVYGQRITSIVKGFEGRSVFFPAAGRYSPTLKYEGERGDYWGSELVVDADNNSSSDYARFMTVNSSRASKGSSSRSYGCSIRPVVSLNAISK